jgi:hypothetical protein
MRLHFLRSSIGALTLSTTLLAAGQEIKIDLNTGVIIAPFKLTQEGVYQTKSTDLTNGGRAEFVFIVTNSGDYRIEAVVKAEQEGENSFYVAIDQKPSSAAQWRIPRTSGYETRTVSWLSTDPAAKAFNLTNGFHRLIMVGKSPKTYLKSVRLVGLPPIKPQAPKNLHIVSSGNQPMSADEGLGSQCLAINSTPDTTYE